MNDFIRDIDKYIQHKISSHLLAFAMNIHTEEYYNGYIQALQDIRKFIQLLLDTRKE